MKSGSSALAMPTPVGIAQTIRLETIAGVMKIAIVVILNTATMKMFAVLVAVKEFAVSRKNHHTKIEKVKRYAMIATNK